MSAQRALLEEQPACQAADALQCGAGYAFYALLLEMLSRVEA